MSNPDTAIAAINFPQPFGPIPNQQPGLIKAAIAHPFWMQGNRQYQVNVAEFPILLKNFKKKRAKGPGESRHSFEFEALDDRYERPAVNTHSPGTQKMLRLSNALAAKMIGTFPSRKDHAALAA